MTYLDINGDQLEIRDLVGRLIYRQQNYRQAENVPINKEMNLFICWAWHVREGTRVSERCMTCTSKWRYQIREGVLSVFSEAGQLREVRGRRPQKNSRA